MWCRTHRKRIRGPFVPSRLAALVIAILLGQVLCAAQQNNPFTRTNVLATKVAGILETIPDEANDQASPELSVDPKVLFEHNAWKLEFEKRIYEWQFVTSKLVFGMVVAMVLAGMYFSWMHFEASFRPRKRGKPKQGSTSVKPDDQTPEPPEVTQLEAYGVKLSTPILGVVILGFSFIFFYLYLQFVYPIT